MWRVAVGDLDPRDGLQVKTGPRITQIVDARRHPPDWRRLGVELVGIVPRHSHVAERAERSPTIGRQIEPIDRRLRGKVLGRVLTQLRTTWAPRAPAAFIKVMNYRPAVVVRNLGYSRHMPSLRVS